MRRTAPLALFLAVFFIGFASPAARAESGGFRFALSGREGWGGDSVELSVTYDGSLDIGVFLLRVDFDPAVFELQSTRKSMSFQEAVTTTLEHDTWVGFGCVSKKQPLAGDSVFSCRFALREEALQGEAVFRVMVYEVWNRDVTPLPGKEETLTYTVLPPPSTDSTLLELVPSGGELEPAFSPDCYDYQVTVPFSVRTLTFQAAAAEGAVCRVNRKNLGAGGTDSEFLLTVTAEDNVTKTVYRVTAHREEREVSPKPSPTPRPSAAPKPTITPKPTTTRRPSVTPKPAVTPKPTAAPAAVPSPMPTASPVPAAERVQAAETPGPTPPETERASPEIIVRRETVKAAPALTFRVADGQAAFYFWGGAFLLAALVLSRPLARLILRRPPGEDRDNGKKE